ncbi:MAG: sugar phosphate nucleotidyltransferase [Sphingomonas sp.]
MPQARTGRNDFTYRVKDPSRYGVVEFDDRGLPTISTEKPAKPQSDQAVTGLYLFNGSVADRAARLRPASRGELEIVDLIRTYLEDGELDVEPMGRGFAWLDTGTHDSLVEAAEFVLTLRHRQGIQIACLEESPTRRVL